MNSRSYIFKKKPVTRGVRLQRTPVALGRTNLFFEKHLLTGLAGADMNSRSYQTFFERVTKLAYLLFKTGLQKNQSPNRQLPVFAPKAASFKQHLPSWLLMFQKSWHSLSLEGIC
jgi:hypothetical protein